MNKSGWMQLGSRIALISAMLLLGACQVLQPQGRLNQCQGAKDECAEVTLRYFQDGKLELADTKTGGMLTSCRVCNPKAPGCTNQCKGASGTITHSTTLQLFRTEKSPGCVLLCSDNQWCTEVCW